MSLQTLADTAKKLAEAFDNGELVKQTDIADCENGISLFALKNDALLSYINNIALIIAGQLKRSLGEDTQSEIDDAVKRTIEQRVTMEKGIKGLESKISYQVDKALRAYRKSIETTEQPAAEAAGSEDDESDDDLTSYRPNVQQLQTRNGGSEDEGSEEEGKSKKYRVPKIAATTQFSKDRKSRRRDFTMEEFIEDTQDAPVAEPSIGTTIQDHGRGGMSTEKDRRKAREVQTYEEDNFTRIQNVSSKQARRDARQRQRDAMSKSFFGEDWGFLEDGSGSGKRRAKGGNNNSKRRKR